jgi:hypothetical protein
LEQGRQPTPQTWIRTLLTKGLGLPASERSKRIGFIHTGVVIRFRQSQHSTAKVGDTFHFKQGLQWVAHPQQEKVAIGNIKNSGRIWQSKCVPADERRGRDMTARLGEADRFQVQPVDGSRCDKVG